MSSLTFRSVRVVRMPGIRDGYQIEGLAPGVNIVFGPNGSGKSTTARALEALLWPRTPTGEVAWLEARFAADGQWSVELDSGRVSFQRDGAPHAAPALPPATDRDRYHLSLPDLLKEEDKEFAKAVAVEGAGGYDLDDAAEQLERRRAPQTHRPERKELEAVRAARKDAEQRQRELFERGRTLRAKEARLDGRAALEARRALLELSLQRSSTEAELAAVRSELAAFDPIMAELHGDEDDRVGELRRLLHGAEDDLAKASESAGELSRKIQNLGVADPARLQERCQALTILADDLDRADREVGQATDNFAGQRKRVEEAERALARTPGEEVPARVLPEDLQRITSIARRLEDLRQQRLPLEAEIAHLGAEGAGANRAELERHAELLRRWLRLPAGSGRAAMWPALVAVGLAALLALALATVEPLALLAIPVAGVLAWFLVRPSSSPAAAEREEVQRALEAAGLRPESWEAAEVAALLSRVESEITAANAAAHEAERRRVAEGKLRRLREEEAPVRADFAALLERHGVRPEGDHLALSALLERLEVWQRARAEEASCRVVLDSGRQQQEALLAEANALLREISEVEVTSSRELRLREGRITERVRRYGELDGQLQLARRAEEEARRTIDRAEKELSSIHARLGITAADEPRLPELCGERAAFREVRRKYEVQSDTLDRLDQQLAARPDFDPDLLRTTVEERQTEVAEIARELEELQKLREQVGGLRAEIELAKRGHELEDAIAREESCEEALRTARRRDMEACIAQLVVDHARSASRSENLPEVFHRANALFTRITHGRYALQLGDAGEPTFRAFDTEAERSHPLEELSSGTRVQLLLAVRVAFVEAQERGLQLPIVLDETLANSDDPRAFAIMEALIELAGEGRQLFYFTAQPDEVRKWRSVLSRHPQLPNAVVDLGEVRSLSHRLPQEALSAADDGPPPPLAPLGPDYREYGRRLGVPRVDYFAPVGKLHLWYLLDDPEPLHAILAGLKVERWGPLAALLEVGRGDLLPLGLAASLEHLASAAGHPLKLLQVGRGRPVDRAALIASGAVSDRFLDEVDALCRDVSGDAGRIIEGLSDKAVPGFRVNNLEALTVFFEEEGYLDRREPVTRGRLRVEILGRLTPSARAAGVEVRELDGLIDRLLLGSGLRSEDAAAESSSSATLI